MTTETEPRMSRLDILAALYDRPTTGTKRCKYAASLAEIPEDAEGRDELMRLLAIRKVKDREYLSNARVSIVMGRLGLPVGQDSIQEHRADPPTCTCYR